MILRHIVDPNRLPLGEKGFFFSPGIALVRHCGYTAEKLSVSGVLRKTKRVFSIYIDCPAEYWYNLLGFIFSGKDLPMEHKCKCKNGGKGHNFIPDRITLTGEGGKEISNRDLVCHHCVYKKRGDTSSCLRFDIKPKEVIAGGKCEAFLSGDLGGKSRSCGNDCDNCGDCGNNCGSCGFEH